MKILSGIVIVVSLVILPSFFTKASEITLQESDVDVVTIPVNPEPYSDMTIKLVSYATDLNKAFIEWRNGSKTLMSGYGKLSYSFKAGGPNTTTEFFITITTPDSLDRIIKHVSITPSEIEIMWEGVDSYTPPFYRGKSFPSSEGLIKAVAVPNTTTGKSSNITYTWKSGDTTQLEASGYNKNYFIFSNNELNTNESVTVTASSVDGKYNATKTIEIPIVNPKIIFYEKSPSEGILYHRALAQDSFLNGDEMTIVAEPYYLAFRGHENNFSYDWKINDMMIGTPSKKTQLTVHPTERGGYATIDLSMENLNYFFQKVTGSLQLTL